jgi:hypothetical protein
MGCTRFEGRVMAGGALGSSEADCSDLSSRASIPLLSRVDRLTNTRTILTDEAIGQMGRAVTGTLTKMRGCASNAGQMQPYLSDNAAEIGDTVGRP